MTLSITLQVPENPFFEKVVQTLLTAGAIPTVEAAVVAAGTGNWELFESFKTTLESITVNTADKVSIYI